MEITNNHVISALDLSRANKGHNDLALYGELNQIVLLGREIDLLETIRREENPENDFFTFPKQHLIYYAAAIGIEPVILEKITILKLQEADLINITDGNEIEVNFKDFRNIFEYGKSQINNELSIRDQKLLDLLSKGMVKPIAEENYKEVISIFPGDLRQPLSDYLNRTRLLCSIQAKDTLFYSSPKIYKHKDSFRKILEYCEDDEVSKSLEYLSQNPGIPLDSISPESFDHNLLKGLTLSGALDSITLNIDGVPRQYLVPSNLNSERMDKDHLDQVKKTLANFRFGERYATWTLHDTPRFLQKLLDTGFAGDASPIGTDYRNLELSGIIKVEKTQGSRFRLWMLKKDVIEDTLKVLKGSVPLITRNPNVNLNEMDNSVLSRMILSQSAGQNVETTVNALRKLGRGLL